MATIDKRGGKYRCVIRKKGINLSATFSDKETTEIWGRYHEDLIDEMHNFAVPPEGLITLEQCCELKLKDLMNKNASKRSAEDVHVVKEEFSEILKLPLNKITTEIIREITDKMLGAIARRGGSKDTNTGKFGIVSPATVLRKLRCLAAIINLMIMKGANLINPVQVVINQLKMSMAKNGIKEEDDNE